MAREPGELPTFELTSPVLTTSLPAGARWVHEVKHDGHRCAAVIKAGKVRLLSRTHREMTRRFPVIATALLALADHDAIIDGEIAAQDERGVAKLETLHEVMESGRHERVVYIAFDLLFLDGEDLRPQPLIERKDVLRKLLAPLAGTRIQYSEHLQGDATRLYERLCEIGAEGVVSKAATAPYRGGRDPSWLKIKCRAWAAEHAKTIEKWNIVKQSRKRP